MFGMNMVPIARVTIDVGAATREYTFRVPFPCMVVEIHSAADAADATDKYTASLNQGATVLKTGTIVTAADAVTVDAVDQVYLAPSIDYKLILTFAGTATNVKGVSVTVWAVHHK